MARLAPALVVAGFVLLETLAAAGTHREHVVRLAPKVVEGWLKDLQAGEAALVEGRWKRAKSVSRTLIRDMNERIVSGEGVAELFAGATFIEAIAEAGLGELEAADWDLSVALLLNPKLEKVELARYGKAGEDLREHRKSAWADRRDAPDEPDGAGEEIGEDSGTVGGITPPKRVHTVRPVYPSAQYQGCVEGPIVVQVILDELGIPRSPRLLSTQDPILGYAALQAMGDWRFRPALVDGQPTRCFFNLTVNFDSPYCKSFSKPDRRSGS